jgi:Protein of unknown function (DUF2846)
MKIVLIAVLLAVSAFAQSPASQMALACGPQGVSFDVKLDNSQHTVVQPAPGKAQVYFIQDKGLQSFGIGGTVVSMIGIDGAWTGENKNNSYFSVSVEPGEHHVCANMQFLPMELSHFIAEAGNIYYFRERVVPTRFGVYLFLELVDSEEGKYLIATYPLSVSRLKK